MSVVGVTGEVVPSCAGVQPIFGDETMKKRLHQHSRLTCSEAS